MEWYLVKHRLHLGFSHFPLSFVIKNLTFSFIVNVIIFFITWIWLFGSFHLLINPAVTNLLDTL